MSMDSRDTRYYDAKEGEWKRLARFPGLSFTEKKIKSVIAHGQLYIVKHTEGFQAGHLDFCTLDTAGQRWVSLAPLPFDHWNFSLVALDHKIYAIGGPERHGGNEAFCKMYDLRSNAWMAIAPLPSMYSVKNQSCVVFRDRIFVYVCRESNYHLALQRNVQDTARFPHDLLMYDAVSNTWSVLLTSEHTLSDSGLVVHDGKCYRVVNGNCRCTRNPSCPWHVLVVHELSIDTENERASVGLRQDQSLIPGRFRILHREACCIGEDVYVICRGAYLKTGIKTTRNQEENVDLSKWEKLSGHSVGHYQPKFVVSYTFDKVLFTA